MATGSQTNIWRVLIGGNCEQSESLVDKLRNERVCWFTDSQNMARILAVGSRNPKFLVEVLSISSMALANQGRIEPKWIPRRQNQKADYINKLVNNDNWSVDPGIFEQLNSRWGHHTINRFASYYNAQLPRFNSRFCNPGTDGFTCDWTHKNNWLCPLICLIHLLDPKSHPTCHKMFYSSYLFGATVAFSILLANDFFLLVHAQLALLVSMWLFTSHN